MADSNPTPSAACCGTPHSDEQRRAERVVLGYLLDEHAAQLTIPELCRKLYGPTASSDGEDAFERAVRDLVGCGLLACEGAFLLPTHAARRFACLELP